MRPPQKHIFAPQRLQRGFTLMELMITVAIVGTLAALAYPAYTDSIRKGKRAEARTALMNLLQQQERYLTQMNTYAPFAVGTPDVLPFKAHSSPSGTRAESSHLLGARVCQAVGGVTPTERDCIEVFAEPNPGVFSDPQAASIAIDTQGRRRCNNSDTVTSPCWK